MKSMLYTAALIAIASALLAGCGETKGEKLDKRTPEQQQQADKIYDMGGPTDRSKSKGY